MPQGWELLILVALVFLLFGAKKMPDAARGIGRSLRILKTETKGLHEDGDAEAAVADAPARDQLTAQQEGQATADLTGDEATADLRSKASKPSKEASASE